MEALSSQSSIASVSGKQPSGDTFDFPYLSTIFLVFLLIAVLSTCLRFPGVPGCLVQK